MKKTWEPITEDIDALIEEAEDWFPPIDPERDYVDRSQYYFRHLLDSFKAERSKVSELETACATLTKERDEWMHANKTIHWYCQKHEEGLAIALEKIDTLTSQLPESMQDCTILFESCEEGHGTLRAANWVKHECTWCEIENLRKDNTKMRNMLAGDAALIENLGLPMNSIHSEVSLNLAQQLIACRAEIAALKKECEQYRDLLVESKSQEP